MTTSDPAVQRSLVGAVLCRRFRLTRKIGDGGMGEVYAVDAVEGGGGAGAHGGKLAVKILLPEFLGEPSVLSRFLDEARTCQRLIHPNIVRVFESLTAEDGSPFIVMELLEGVPLGAYTQNGGRVPMAQAVPILQGILAGLAAAHAQHVVHRDLKPDNVFLTRDGHGHFVIKVLDFGIAKVMDVAGGMGSKTRTGMLLGTPAYMSPEQIKSAKDVDARADLWSAGVMFYEMLTGRVAFPAPTEYARLAAVLSVTPPDVETVDIQLAPLSAFMKKALEKDRSLRFQSALEMSRALTTATVGVEAATASRVEGLPLSRLPDVASIFLPPGAAAAAGGAGAGASGGHGGHGSASMQAAPQVAPETMNRVPVKTPGGTLASPSQASGSSVMEQPPQVIVVAGGHPSGETLPSKDLPMLPARGSSPPGRTGVAPGVVIALVVGALIAGALIGFAVARMM